MAIRFATSNLESQTSNLYNIEKFNGVDYTTTPTQVDDSRAIDVSNYLPEGNSLVKRHGIVSETLIIDGEEHSIFDIWKYAPLNYNKECYVFYVGTKKDETLYHNFKLACFVLDKNSNEWFNFDVQDDPIVLNLYPEEHTELTFDEIYSYGVQFENRLFLLMQGKYLMFWGDVIKTDAGYLSYNFQLDEVKNHAYIPTIITNLTDDRLSFNTGSLEQFNLLTNKCYIELSVINGALETTTETFNIGQFFDETQTLKVVSIDGELPNDDNGITFITQIGAFTYDNSTRHITFNDKAFQEDEKGKTYVIKVEIEFSRNNNSVELVEQMRFGIPYGSSGYRDRLFLTGNPKYPNVDIRSCDATFSENNWQDYTYFGDNEYNALGSSDSKIIEYGLLNNGTMVVLKDSVGGQPNLYIRNYEYSKDANGNIIETFPIVNTGITIPVSEYSQMINYGNDLLVTTISGLYKVVIGDSTATQTYLSNEMSYFIRNNLNSNLYKSDIIVYQNKLYWNKQDVNGKYRIYVADQDRYGVVNGAQVYEWWALDDINTYKMFVFNGEIFFVNGSKISRFNDDFTDEYEEKVTDIVVNGEKISNYVFVDTVNERLVIPKEYDFFGKINKSEDIQTAYKNFIESTTISFKGFSVIETTNTPTLTENDGEYRLIIECTEEETPLITNLLFNSGENGSLLVMVENKCYFVNGYINTYYVDEEDTSKGMVISCEVIRNSIVLETLIHPTTLCFAPRDRIDYGIAEMYTEDKHPFSQCEYIDDMVVFVGEKKDQYIELGTASEVYFDTIELKYEGFPVKFDVFTSVSEVVFDVYTPVKSFWHSKYNSLGRLDYLKSVDRVTFVAESRRGGVTNVGYRTLKNDVSYATELIRKKVDFEYLDFDTFSFAFDTFARTHTAKKKIKNFAFMQITIDSNNRDDSTIVSLSLRYKYTKNNKGVR